MELTDGKRYEIAPDAKSYRVTGFGTYGIRLDIKPDQILSPDKAHSLPTSYLLNDPSPKNLGQFFWRLSWPLMALNLVLFAIPLSFTNPRAGKSLNVVVAVLVFILYLNQHYGKLDYGRTVALVVGPDRASRIRAASDRLPVHPENLASALAAAGTDNRLLARSDGVRKKLCGLLHDI